MSRSPLTEFSRLVLTLYRYAQEVPVHEFQDAVFESLKPALPFDASIWGTGTMTPEGIDIHSFHRYRFPDAMFEAFQRVRHQDTSAARVTSQPRMTIGFSAAEEFTREDQAEIRAFARDYSQHHCIVTADINPMTKFTQWVSLFRSEPERRCMPAEIEFLDALAPHLMQALAINRLVHLDKLVGDTARESWAVAIADPRGVVYHADQRFKTLMGEEWPLHRQEGRLADGLLDQLQGGETHIVGENVIVQRSLEQGLFFLKARPRRAVDSLSPREFVVAKMLVSGMTQKQIAAGVGRSPETIRSQVKAIFAKLDINNVTLLPPLLALRQ
ncbi:helix-turn-helix transcriptional regulator [Ramlibacter humi]|uniref:LuxR family transcriptional regulator n=1 Tax=Ramlibacter humi TaxID=2530451 RepID=A0A4Z0BWE2_9BURK|nr:helix-turn-helix transcriptional regulator [Ramlibacter humi]TFZ03533.1 LuxR family transcriptional regulator [Ramlibacter humi]